MLKKMGIISLSLIALLLGVSLVMAAGNVEKGKALFNDPALGGGTSGRSCNTCHPGGKGLEGVGTKKEWTTPAGTDKTLEGAVNTCITMALKGKPLDVKSEQMKGIIAYLKSLGSGKEKKKKMIEGC
jgi:cytochrome c5